MKKIILFVSVAALASCGKETPAPTPAADTTPPGISLKGKTNDTVSLNATYTDPGANAQDDVDGNISSSIVVSGTVNKDMEGEYRLYYNVKDSKGNVAAQMTRYVYVANDADYLEGNYNATANCGASPTGGNNLSLTASSTINNKISISIPGNVSSITPDIFVNGNVISMPMQTSGTAYITGNGTIASDKLSFSMTYTAASNSSFTGTYMCTTNYVKQ